MERSGATHTLPTYRPDAIHRRTVRYATTAAMGQVAITRAMLLNHQIVNTAGTTTNYRLSESVRIKSVEIWSLNHSGTSNTCAIEWTSEYGPASLVSDTSLGTAIPLHIKTSPPPSSLASFWCVSGANESQGICNITTGGDSDIIEVVLEYVIQNFGLGIGAPTAVTSTAAGTVGTVYTTYLDGVVSGKCRPVSLNSIL